MGWSEKMRSRAITGARFLGDRANHGEMRFLAVGKGKKTGAFWTKTNREWCLKCM